MLLIIENSLHLFRHVFSGKELRKAMVGISCRDNIIGIHFSSVFEKDA